MNRVGIVFLRVNTSHWSLLKMWLEILILGTQSSSISHTHQAFEYSSFFYLLLTSYDLFPHGCKSWAVLAAVQEALEGKRNQMEKYTWILPSWSQSLLSCFSLIVVLPVSWVDVKRGLTHFILFCVVEKKIQEKICRGITDWKRWGIWSAGVVLWEASTFVLYLPLIFTNTYRYCELPFR